MGILKKGCFLLLLGIVNNISFAQEVVSYTNGLTTIIFYDDGTFWHKKSRSIGSLDYLDNDTISFGTYIKEKKDYLLTVLKICYPYYSVMLENDSIENKFEKDSFILEKASIINKRKIMLGNVVFYEWAYFYKKEKRNSEKKTPKSYYRRLERYKSYK